MRQDCHVLTQHYTHNAFLLQVVIGGINVDFIAKGKGEAIQVIFPFGLDIHQHRSSESDGSNGLSSLSSDRPIQEVCVSHLVG